MAKERRYSTKDGIWGLQVGQLRNGRGLCGGDQAVSLFPLVPDSPPRPSVEAVVPLASVCFPDPPPHTKYLASLEGGLGTG